MEVIFLYCGAGGPQLKRNPLGSRETIVDTAIESPVVWYLWWACAGAFVWWYSGRLRDYKEMRSSRQTAPDAHQRLEQLKQTLTIQAFVGMGSLVGLLYILAWVF